MDKTNETEISDLWSSILFNKATTSNLIPPPYIHPISNKSPSVLSTKSLDICTESLCSETGSDNFFPSSEKAPTIDGFFNTRSKLVHATTTHPSRSIPPPLPSLAGRGSGRSLLLVQSRRGDGRLILEAVSFTSSKSCFRAHRVEGRLQLRLEKSSNAEEDDEEEEEECRLS